ncbi:MAG TPA: hypothetical protein VHQ92_01370, partial [Pseudolabrys sp.]|nr:hypothetical protein [Pseudolabrys sp.]
MRLRMLVVEVNAGLHLLNGFLRELLSLGAMSALIVFGGFQFGLRGLKVLKRGAHMRLIFSDE